MKNVYEEIGKLAIGYEANKEQIVEKKGTLQFFKGVQNGLSQAANEVREMIPEDIEILDIYKTIIQLRNWIRSSGGTPEEDKEILKLANKLVIMIGEE